MARTCACVADDAYDCWGLRYHHRRMVPSRLIEQEGGPCECSCHAVECYCDFPSREFFGCYSREHDSMCPQAKGQSVTLTTENQK